MTKKYFITISLYIILVMSLSSCTRLSPCFDKELYKSMKGKGCTEDCPGVIGCNGRRYCNECEANKEGIRIK
jgi:hypothetical protein